MGIDYDIVICKLCRGPWDEWHRQNDGRTLFSTIFGCEQARKVDAIMRKLGLRRNP